jgi:N-acetyltransferase
MRCLFTEKTVVSFLVIGFSSFYEMDQKHRRLSIGYTWYIPRCWGTTVNATVKWLLLHYAFESLHMQRVSFSVDASNARSCAAMEKIGAHKEGVLRKHMQRADGTCRHSVIYAIIDEDWPDSKRHLNDLIGP